MRDMLLDEQQKLLEQSGDVASQLNSMPALDAAIQEILRYRPAVPGAFRRCVRDTEYEGYHIPAGTKIMAGSFLANRSPKIAGTAGGDPEKYCPMRYLASPTKDARPHLAFSAGPHSCIGAGFSLTQMKCYLATFLRTFDFELQEGQDLSYTFVPSMRPKNGLLLSLSERSSSSSSSSSSAAAAEPAMKME